VGRTHGAPLAHSIIFADGKIRELKTALRKVTNLLQTDFLTSLPEVAAYSNPGHSESINMSPPYKADYAQEYPLLDTYRVYPSTVLISNAYYNGP